MGDIIHRIPTDLINIVFKMLHSDRMASCHAELYNMVRRFWRHISYRDLSDSIGCLYNSTGIYRFDANNVYDDVSRLPPRYIYSSGMNHRWGFKE
jgi:hypothetical protein